MVLRLDLCPKNAVDISTAQLYMSDKIWFCIVLLYIILNSRFWLCAERQILSHHKVQVMGLDFVPISSVALLLITNTGKGKGLVLTVVINYSMLTKY